MGSIFYNPEVFAWGDAIGEGMGAYLMGKDIQLKDLQRKKLYEDLAKEAEVKKGLTGITEKEAAGLYAPTVSTTRGRQLTQESPTYDPMGLSSGAVALPTETVQQTTTVPPQRSMYDDLSKMYMRTGNIKEALQAVQLQEFEKKLNSEEGRSALDMVVKLQTAFKGKPIPKELNDIFSSTYPSFKGIDLTKIKPETPDFSFMSYPINVKNTAIIVTDKNAGTSTVKIVDTTEKASTILDIIKVANPIAEGETLAQWNTRILQIQAGMEKEKKTLTPEQKQTQIDIRKESRAPEKPATTGTWTYVGTDEVSGKSILLNSKTGEQRLGERKIEPKPKAKSSVLKDLGLTGSQPAESPIYVNPTTKERIRWDGTKWIPVI